MHPNVGHGLPLGREPDHVHWRGVSRRPARSAFQRGLKFSRTACHAAGGRPQRNARLGFAATAFDLQPAINKRRLRGFDRI